MFEQMSSQRPFDQGSTKDNPLSVAEELMVERESGAGNFEAGEM